MFSILFFQTPKIRTFEAYTLFPDTTKSKFVKAVESVASSVDSEFSLPGDPRQDYKALYHETQEEKYPLIKMLDKWVKTREKLIRAETNTKRKDALLEKTIAAIASLTECVLNTKAERTCVD